MKISVCFDSFVFQLDLNFDEPNRVMENVHVVEKFTQNYIIPVLEFEESVNLV